MNVFVTGSNGYLGGHVWNLLKKRGHGTFDNISPQVLQQTGYNGIDAVVHLGWHAVPGNGSPERQRGCLLDTERLLSRTAGCPAFVYASTASVYGDGDNLSEDSRTAPGCAYTAAKEAGETLVRGHRPRNHLILRFGSLMGVGTTNPGRTRTDLVVNAFASAGWNGRGIDVWDAESVKPVVHVKDAAEVIVRALERGDVTGTMNVARECRRAIEIAQTVVDQILSEEDVTAPEIRVIPNDSGRGTRSTSVLCRRLQKEFPDLRLRTIREAVSEFRNYKS